MPCINIREGDAVVSFINLDGCGTPEPGASGLLQLETVAEFSYEDQVTDGDKVTEKNLGGRPYYQDTGCAVIDSIAVSLTSGGLNPSLDSSLVGSSVKLDLEGAIRGFGRRDLSCAQNIAVEVLMRLDTDACSGSGAAPIMGWLLPLTKDWRTAGANTLNGTDLLKPQFSGSGFKNSRLFDTLVEPLAKWEDIYDENEWYAAYLFDGADITFPTADCEPIELAVVSS